MRKLVVELELDNQETFVRGMSFLFLKDNNIQLDSSKTFPLTSFLWALGQESLYLKSKISYNDPETKVSDVDSQRFCRSERETIGRFSSRSPANRCFIIVIVVFSCTLQFLEGSESKSNPTEVR